MMWVPVLLLSLVALLLPQSTEAKVYRCEGAGGTTILTDQPKGKRACVLVTTPSPSPPGGFTPPEDLVAPAQIDLPPAAMPHAASPIPRPPLSGDPSIPPPQVSTEPQAAAAPEAQHCSPRVNPLNPFAGLNCSPASGNKPGETKNP